MIKCKDVAHEASDYLDGNLSFRRKIGVKLHLMICKACRRYIKQLDQTVEAVSVTNPQEKDLTDTQALAKQLHACCKKTGAGEH